jgi:hypothetical protein
LAHIAIISSKLSSEKLSKAFAVSSICGRYSISKSPEIQGLFAARFAALSVASSK